MNKYLKGFINLIIGVTFGLVGALFTCNMLVAGLLFFPDVVDRAALLMDANPSWLAAFYPGLIPHFFLLSILGLAIFSMFLTMRLVGKCNIERIIAAIQKRT